MKNKTSKVFDTAITKTVSLAVCPIDDFTLERPLCDLSMYIEEEGQIPAISNSDGFFIFLDIASSKITLIIEDSKYYKKDKRIIDLEELRNNNISFQRNPSININLIPNTSYPFPSHSTIIRGSVLIKDINLKVRPGINAEVKIKERKEMITFTNDRGEYMLYFNKIKIEEDILEQEVDESGHIKRRFINMGGTIKFIMLIDCPGIPRFEREYEKGAEESKTTLVNILLVEGS